MRRATSLISNFTDAQLGNQWSVPRKNAQIPGRPRNLGFFCRLLHQQPRGSNDFELESIFH